MSNAITDNTVVPTEVQGAARTQAIIDQTNARRAIGNRLVVPPVKALGTTGLYETSLARFTTWRQEHLLCRIERILPRPGQTTLTGKPLQPVIYVRFLQGSSDGFYSSGETCAVGPNQLTAVSNTTLDVEAESGPDHVVL